MYCLVSIWTRCGWLRWFTLKPNLRQISNPATLYKQTKYALTHLIIITLWKDILATLLHTISVIVCFFAAHNILYYSLFHTELYLLAVNRAGTWLESKYEPLWRLLTINIQHQYEIIIFNPYETFYKCPLNHMNYITKKTLRE